MFDLEATLNMTHDPQKVISSSNRGTEHLTFGQNPSSCSVDMVFQSFSRPCSDLDLEFMIKI